MKIAAISDVHVKTPGDEADRLLISFWDNPEVRDSDYIALLGDIFDLMCGPHEQYLIDFKHHFDRMNELALAGKKIFFFEGNHDVHLEKLFLKKWQNREVILSQVPIKEKIDGKLYYFSHGDEHEIDNTNYQKYIKLIRSAPLRFFANYLLPYCVLNYLGDKASKQSRKIGAKTFDKERVRVRFRNGVVQTTRGEYDFILGGHSHVKDEFIFSQSKSVYINNGYAVAEKTFILINQHNVQFISLV